MSSNAVAIEQIRFAGEQRWADELRRQLGAGASSSPPDPQRIRRMILASSVRLSPTMSPEAHAAVLSAAARLGVVEPVELYQSAGEPNASAWLCENPAVIEVQGAMLALLEPEALTALMGHELGHHAAHNRLAPGAEWGALLRDLVWGARAEVAFAASRLSMSREITADRCALVACGHLDGLLRLMMATTTGLPTNALTWDTAAYLEQCRELIESTSDVAGSTHPEHSFRAWAASLFASTTEFGAISGKGGGTLTLVEADQRILERLGHAGLNIEQLDSTELPTELHECALAGAVLVASADGTLAERESAAIERTFAPLVADWQSYLEPSGALIRFNELSAVMAAAPVEAHRSLASLLLHVIGSDEVVTENEVEMFGAIGDAIGCGTMFRAMLPSALRAMGATVTAAATSHAAPTLPARAGEVDAALVATFRSIARRGADVVPIARLMRVAGRNEIDAAFVEQLRVAWTSAGLTCSTPLEGLTRMSVLELAASGPIESAPPRVDPSDPAIQRLRRALVGLRDSLVTGDGRSPSVRIHAPRTGRVVDLVALDSISAGLAARVVALVSEGARATLVEAAEAGRHDAAMSMSTQLRALYREDRARRDETGAADLFFGSPVLTGVIDGYLVRAPLVLHSAALVTDSRGAGSWTLVPTADEPPIVNQALIQLVFHRLGYGVDDALILELDEAAANGASAVIERLRARGLEIQAGTGELVPLADRSEVFARWPARRFEIEECALLGFFPQSSSDILHDYDALIAAIDAGEPPQTLLGAAMELLPSDMRGAFGDDGAATAAASTAGAPLEPVLAVDSSQRNVLVRARQARALVVHGPPGTGKSQVIVNLVADALARGERVAVVCEKRAAIDVVVQRLDAIGMRHLLAPVHDVAEDRKALYAQLIERLELNEPRRHDEALHVRIRNERDAIAQALQGRLDALHRPIDAAGLSLAQLHEIASSVTQAATADGPSGRPSAAPGTAALDATLRDRIAARVGALAPHFDVIAPASPMRAPRGWAPRRSVAALDGTAAQQIDQSLELLGRAAAAVEQQQAALGVRATVAAAAQPGLRALAASRGARQSTGVQRIMVAALLRNDPAVLQPLARLSEVWSASREDVMRAQSRVRFESSEALEVALPVATRWSLSFFRFFVLAWWRARGVIRDVLAQQWPERAASRVDPVLLADVRTRSRASTAWKAFDAAFSALFGSAQQPVDAATADAFVGELSAAWPHLQTMYGVQGPLRELGAWPQSEAELVALDARVESYVQLADLEQARVGASASLLPTFGWIGAIDAARIAALARFWRLRSAACIEVDRVLDALEGDWPAVRTEIDAVADRAALQSRVDNETLRDCLVACWAEAWIDRLSREQADVAALDGPTMYGDVATLETRVRQLESQIRQHEVSRIAAARDNLQFLLEAPAEPRKRRTATQAAREAMLKEARKQRNVMPLRTFVRRFADEGLLDALPVWLLSPETMVVLFNRAPIFDVVIFDEASQCTMESGFPVMMRGRRVVIAGDDKQMPPTSFFMANVENDVAAEEEDDAIGLLDAESLLVLARDRAQQAPLLWHYRCLYEELIAFSNYAMYGGELRTIPAVDGRHAQPLRWVAVDNGEYVDGANPNEARRVIDEVSALLSREKPPTVGVVTFNVNQQKAILDEIDARKARDEAFAALWNQASSRERIDERPFVKNIESVQGDERDVIVFSLGHAPTTRKLRGGQTEKYVAARFGPLNLRGGERRLNVAVSRAKRECVIVASFEPSMLSVSGSRNEGPRLFKAFLEFAHDLSHGRRAQADRTLQRIVERAHRSTVRPARQFESILPVSVQIAEALRSTGLDVEVGVGSSGFKVPLAIRPQHPGGRAIAVLTDDMVGASSAFEAHVHIPAVLEGRGWRVTRINSRQWHRSPAEVIATLRQMALEEAARKAT